MSKFEEQVAEAALANDHRLSKFHIDLNGAPAAYRVQAECACANPDGNGEGRMDFAGPSVFDVVDQWIDHLDQVVLAQLPAVPAVAGVLVEVATS